jgi:hypothetical protein
MKSLILLLVFIVFFIHFFCQEGEAQNQGNVAIPWTLLGGGGAPASSGSVVLNASLGQNAIGVYSSDHFDLLSGFWNRRGDLLFIIHLPMILKIQ